MSTVTARPAETTGAAVQRRFTSGHDDGYADVTWGRRDARITDYRTGEAAFEQDDVEFPESWSQNASNIVAQKYFRGPMDSPERESSLRQVIDRVVSTVTGWGVEGGYFADEPEALAFSGELTWLLVHQRVAFNSPVWFNIGVKGAPKQASACFILSVEDTMDSILNWYREEGVIFKGGSGAGVNLSGIRSSYERLSSGGSPSGPVSFMRGADASAGTIKSGGTTRRAAKMVVLDVEHPDVEDFIWCKAIEERKARVLADAGFDMDLDGADSHSVQYQNANNSVRLSDEFMEAVESDAEWALRSVATGEVLRTVRARELLHQIAEAAWECADPGVQFSSTINRWHTASVTGPINASNPCSEYLHLDDSACNLASLNLLSFLDEHGEFDIDGFAHAVNITLIAQEILVGNADYPTEAIGETTRRFRQLGLGYANLGALLMALGLPYDSEAGRAWAGSITALMTGAAYRTSAHLAERLGPYAGFAENREPQLGVLRAHRKALAGLSTLQSSTALNAAAAAAWDEAIEMGDRVGVRNAQVSVLAPTGTISFMMDCDTTGIEPDLGLVKTKKLVGGGTMAIVNQTVPRALRRLGYEAAEIDAIVAYIAEERTAVGAPSLRAEHVDVFACAMGRPTIGALGHLRMMAAVQPFLSGGISKTVNLKEETTVGELEALLIESWKLGIKAVAVYRDNCKVGQPLSAGKDPTPAVGDATAPVAPDTAVIRGAKDRLPRSRRSRTFEFRVADCKGYATVGEYDDGRPGELFVRVSKQGSTLAGIMDAFAISVSHGLQYGVPLASYVRGLTGMRFEPAGMTDDPDIRIANSLMDYLFRRLALDYLSETDRAELGIFSVSERLQPTLPGVEEGAVETVTGQDLAPIDVGASTSGGPPRGASQDSHAPLCMQCGVQMVRSGSCHACPECGSTSGCS